MSDEDRIRTLDAKIWDLGANGWTLVNKSGFYANLEKGKPANHILHLLLSIVTAGVWIPIWIIITLASKKKTLQLYVEDDGSI